MTGRDGSGDRTSPEPDGGVAVTGHAHRADGGAARGDWLRWVGTVARQEHRLSIRNRWAYALVGLFATFAVLVAGVEASRAGPFRTGVVVVSLASLATYLVPLAAIAFGYDVVVGADEAGWLDVVFALPADRSAIVAGSYLGRAVTLAAATLVGFAPAGALLVALGGTASLAPYAAFVLGAVGLGLSFLALGVAVSAAATQRTHALGAALGVWVWFVFVHDLLALGALASADLPGAVATAFVLANPADLFRVIVLGATGTTDAGAGAALASTGLALPLAAAALVAWCVLPVALAGLLVGRRSV